MNKFITASDMEVVVEDTPTGVVLSFSGLIHALRYPESVSECLVLSPASASFLDSCQCASRQQRMAPATPVGELDVISGSWIQAEL